ncbi:nitroreductase family protein [Burkholderia anthina]|uniref:nitroreductase family protein n=1 Tax=Burkholderia anthina TaxID=179879 RepID=UPI001CF32F6C|nr:nitroreductase family protein [Burkholderia anthina]MCA8091931.1 nitroreductase family protein [Burkholderia anthina]
MTEQQLLAYSPAPAAQPASPQGESPAIVDLPRPMLDSDVTLMAALASRTSSREFATTPLPPATLGTMLWAADGINRPASGGRTAPSAHAFNEIDIYVALPYGVYRYDAAAHRLVLKHAVDARNLTGYQDFVGRAPLDLVYVVRTAAILDMPPQQRDVFSAIAAGAIAQNVSLYCAAAGLGTVVRGWIDHRALADALRLNEDELPILAQTVGYRASTTVSHA